MFQLLNMHNFENVHYFDTVAGHILFILVLIHLHVVLIFEMTVSKIYHCVMHLILLFFTWCVKHSQIYLYTWCVVCTAVALKRTRNDYQAPIV